MNKKLLILGACCIFFLMFYKTLFFKPLVGINTYIKTNIRKIESITNADSGMPLVLVVGTTKDGHRKGVWFDRRSFFSFKLHVEASLENAISKEDALTIIKENKLLQTISYVQLDYIDFGDYDTKISKGTYWHAGGEATSYSNEGTMYLYINPFTKKYILLGSNNKVIQKTID
jgi:hypothetical protein